MTSRSEFQVIAKCLSYPAVEAPFATTITIDTGEEAWEFFAQHSTPPARAAVLNAVTPWLVPEMLVTEAARTRLRRWAEEGGLANADTPSARQASIRRLTIVGDALLLPVVEQALIQIPPPVLEHLRRHAVLLPVGFVSAGVCALDPPVEPDAVEVRRLIPVRYERGAGFLSRLFRRLPCEEDLTAEFMALVGHEVAHAWLVPAPTLTERLTRAEATERYETYIRCAVEWGLLERVIKPLERDEHQAEDLARAWGFERATRRDACAWNVRRIVQTQAAAIARGRAGEDHGDDDEGR